MLSGSALPHLEELISRFPCFRPIHLLFLHGLCHLRSDSFSGRLEGTSFFLTSHGTLFRLVRKAGCQLRPIGGRHPITRHVPIRKRSEACSLVSDFLTGLPRRGPQQSHPMSTSASCVTFLVRDRSTPSSVTVIPHVRRRSLVSSFVNRKSHHVILDSIRSSRLRIPGLSRRGIRGRSCFARALTGVCVGRNECAGTVRVVQHLDLGCPGGGHCFTSRVQFLSGLVVGGGGGGT